MQPQRCFRCCTSSRNGIHELQIFELQVPSVINKRILCRKNKLHMWATYRQDDIRCRNRIPSAFMPYSVFEIASIRLELVPMVVLWHRKVWVYIVSESLCCLNLQAREQPINNPEHPWKQI
jgi:hypothetical protein